MMIEGFKGDGTSHRQATSILLMLGVGIPNAPFLVANLIGVGTPPRSAGILLHVLATLIGRLYGRAALMVAVIVAFLVDIALTIASLFGFFVGDLPKTLRFADKVDFFAAPFYVGMVAVLASALVTSLVVAWQGYRRLASGSLGTLIVVAACLGCADYVANRDPHYGIGRMMAGNSPVISAMNESGLQPTLLHDEPRHRVIVMVEGLGVHENMSSVRAINAPLLAAAAKEKRKVTRGVIPYYGATKEGELRELCETRRLYTDFMNYPDSSCVPLRSLTRGYRVLGIHSYAGDMFERDQWWNNIGLTTQIFAEDLPHLPQCGKTFSGACDTAVVLEIGKMLKAAKGPLLVFFLTVNTHVPITPGQHSGTMACARRGLLGIDNLCHLNMMWHDLFRHLAMLLSDPETPKFDLLIVGDHAPPLWSRKERQQFKAGVVPWIRVALP